jgi:hypothetical protein
MALPNLRELDFKRLSLPVNSIRRLPSTPLRITSLRFIHCSISVQAVKELIEVCPSLVKFVYTLGGGVWPTRHRASYFELGMVKQYLLTRCTTLNTITIINMQVPLMPRICAMGSLLEFTVLEHLCVNQLHLMPTDKRRSWIQTRVHEDATQYLLTLPSSLNTVELYHCDADETLSTLRRLSGRIPHAFPNLKTLKIRLRQLLASLDLQTEKMWDGIEHVEFGRIGLRLDISVVTSDFWQ